MAIHIVQLLCAKRHCIFAIAFPAEDMTDAEGIAIVEEQMKVLVEAKTLNPWCGLCGSKDLHCEAGRTKYQTMEEALPHLAETEIKQLITRQRWQQNPMRN